jgi:hypothetical protein
MKFFEWFKKKNEPKIVDNKIATEQFPPIVKAEPKADFTRIISSEEKEIAAVIASAIVAEGNRDSKFRVKSITGIDTEKEIAAAIVSAMAAGDHPNSNFRLVSITEVK